MGQIDEAIMSRDYHYPYIGKRFVQNLPEIKLSAADFAWDQHEPLRKAPQPHPEPSRSSAIWVVGGTLWSLMSLAQDCVIEAHKPLVDCLVATWMQTRDEGLKQRLIDAGYQHRIDAIEINEMERYA